jgi:hypothetical protein
MLAELDHAFTFRISGIEGTRSLQCCPVRVADSTLTISAPLRGGQWAAVNGPSNSSDHRRALLPIDGHLYLGQRFAIDWVKLNASGQPASGDGSENKQFFGYSEPVLAVADGTVAAIQDGIPENKPGSLALKMDYSNIAGNFVSLDLGAGRFAGYAHLQPGSIRVKKDQRVHRGDVLGLLGNSGNSDAPHLHFEISDGPSLTQSEGLPYTLDSFKMTGSVDKDLNFTPAASGEHKIELPLENVVVTFPDAPHLHFEISDGPSLTQSEGLPYTLDSFKMTGSVDKDLNFTPAASGEHKIELPLENVVVTFQ